MTIKILAAALFTCFSVLWDEGSVAFFLDSTGEDVKRAAARYFKCHRSPTHEIIMHTNPAPPTMKPSPHQAQHEVALSFQVQIPTSKSHTGHDEHGQSKVVV